VNFTVAAVSAFKRTVSLFAAIGTVCFFGVDFGLPFPVLVVAALAGFFFTGPVFTCPKDDEESWIRKISRIRTEFRYKAEV
jgi:hypothetical protein